MNFNNFTLNSFSDAASRKFEELQNRLSKLGSSFQARMEGNTTIGLIVKIFGTLLWAVIFAVGIAFASPRTNSMLLLITAIACLLLIVSMLIDHITNISYYGKISVYGNTVAQLERRVAMGKNSIRANQDIFMRAKANGWNHPLPVATSIPEEATGIENTLQTMESLKTGFIQSVKNVFFFIVSAAIAITAGSALFSIGNSIMGLDNEAVANVLNIVALIIATIGQIILSKAVWSATDCTVKNVTLLILAVGPVAYLALIGLGTLLVVVILGVLQIALYIIGLIVVGAFVFGSTCGG